MRITTAKKLANGVEIPCLGFGTYKIENEAEAYAAVREALALGYRHVDTAAFYQNEAAVGKAVRDSGIPREQIFITSKLWTSDWGYENALAAFDKTLARLGLDYLDLYLIHWPAVKARREDWEAVNLSTWRAFTELYKAGKIRAIGVSNFTPKHLAALMRTKTPPMVNQIEYHVGHEQAETVDFCKRNGILVEAWSPLGRGRVLQNETLLQIAKQYGKSVAQICIRWCLQNDVLPLPKSATAARIAENADVFDFSISDEHMAALAALPPFGASGLDPETFNR